MAAVGPSRPISAAMRHSTDWHTFRTIVTDMTVLRTYAALGLSMRLWHWTVRHWRHERACIGQPWPCFAPPSDPSNTTEYGVHDKDIRDREDPVLMGDGKYPAGLVAVIEAFQSIECRVIIAPTARTSRRKVQTVSSSSHCASTAWHFCWIRPSS